MSASPEVMQSLMEKIRNLPSERVAEIVDFVERLRDKLAKQGDISVVKPTFEIPVLPVKKKGGMIPFIIVGAVAVSRNMDKTTDLSFSREGMYDDDGR